MQEDEHHGDRWFKEAVQQAKMAETIQAMKAETRAQGTPLGETGRFTHGALTPDDEGELRYAVTASGGKVILAFGTPVEWIGMTPRMAHRLADALNKWARCSSSCIMVSIRARPLDVSSVELASAMAKRAVDSAYTCTKPPSTNNSVPVT